MKTIKIVLITLLLINTSCTDNTEEEINTFDYLTFGHFYGFCGGDDCVKTYQLTNENLYKDTVKDYSGEVLNFIELSHEKFELTKDLIDTFPIELLENDTTFIGCPDCTDGGGLFIQYSKNDIVKSWRIDLFKENTPDYLHDFIDKVQEKIALINN